MFLPPKKGKIYMIFTCNEDYTQEDRRFLFWDYTRLGFHAESFCNS